MVDWLAVRADPIEAVEHGAEAASEHFRAGPYVGPRTYDGLDYPAIEVLPDSTERTGPTNWTHSIVVNCYFQRSRGLEYVGDVLHPIAAVLDECLDALSDVGCANNYYPESIQDFAGELDNTSVLLVSIRLRVTTSVNPGEF